MRSRRRYHVVLLMHGSHGSSKDWRYLASRLAQESPLRQRIVLAPDVLCGFRTDRGLVACSDALYEYLTKQLDALLHHLPPSCCETSEDEEKQARGHRGDPLVILSCVGHSFGGLVARRTVARVLEEYGKLQSEQGEVPNGGGSRSPSFKSSYPVVAGGMCCFVGAPLCGVATMPSPVMRWIGKAIGRCASQTYADMFLLNRVFEEDAIRGGGSFQHTWLISDCRDALVPLQSSSLLPREVVARMRHGYASFRRIATDHEVTEDINLWQAVSDNADVPATSSIPLPRASVSFELCREGVSRREGMPSALGGLSALHALTDSIRLLRQEQLLALSPPVLSVPHRWQGAQVQSTVVDMLQGAHNIAATTTTTTHTPPASVCIGAKQASHRALICKDPMHVPQYFGHVCDSIAERLMLFD